MKLRSDPFNCKAKLFAEANIQAEFYTQCRIADIPIVLEYSTPAGRVDAAIFTDFTFQRLCALVECKKESKIPMELTEQIERYKTLGIPIFGLNKLSKCKPLAAQIKRQMSDYPQIGQFSVQEIKLQVKGRRAGNKRYKNDKHFKAIAHMVDQLDPDINFKGIG